MKQMSFFGSVDEKEVYAAVIEALDDYPAWLARWENEKEREEAGVGQLFPVLVENRAATIQALQVKRALESLDVFQREIIKRKYLSCRETNDMEIWMELGIKKGKYYRNKKRAIKKIATALGII